MGSSDSSPARATSNASSWILSTPKLVGIGVAVVVMILLLDIAWPIALVAGLGGYIAAVFLERREQPQGRMAMDPFTVGEPWRQFVQGAQRSAKRLHETVESTSAGPLKDRMLTIEARLDDGLAETWTIARRGDQIDGTIRHLDPASLRSKLDTLEKRRAETENDDVDAAIASVRSQIEATGRLKFESTKTADRLRLTQTRLDELVSRAAEVSIGAGDTDAYEHDVDDLVIELESLRQAVEETNRQ